MSESAPSRPPERGEGVSNGSSPRSGTLFERLRTFLGLRSGDSVREALEDLIEQHDETLIDADERELLRNILEMRDADVADVMVPRAHIIALDVDMAFDEAVRAIADAAHSRLPVYRESLDDVLGMIHIKDVIGAMIGQKPSSLEAIIRPVLFVPSSMPALDLLVQMRTQRTHLAIVIDEYGGTDGLVTIEDLVEQIVGEIEDEHDVDEAPQLERAKDGSLIADAAIAVEDLESVVGPLREANQDEIDTLGGLVISIAGRVPGAGEVIAHPSGIEFEVVAADPRRVSSVRLRNLPARSEPLSA